MINQRNNTLIRFLYLKEIKISVVQLQMIREKVISIIRFHEIVIDILPILNLNILQETFLFAETGVYSL